MAYYESQMRILCSGSSWRWNLHFLSIFVFFFLSSAQINQINVNSWDVSCTCQNIYVCLHDASVGFPNFLTQIETPFTHSKNKDSWAKSLCTSCFSNTLKQKATCLRFIFVAKKFAAWILKVLQFSTKNRKKYLDFFW